MKGNFILSTTNSLEGYEIKKYYGICSERLVVGVGLFSEFFAGFTDIFGGRSAKLEDNLNELYIEAMEKLKKNALKKGANGLLGVKMDIDEISGKNMMMLMISVYGTAVLINNLSNTEENDNFEEEIILSGSEIENQIKTKNFMERLTNCETSEDFEKLLDEMLAENILLPLDYLLTIINDSTKEFIKDIKEYNRQKINEKLVKYLELYEKKNINDNLNKIIININDSTNLFTNIYTTFSSSDYKVISKLLDKLTFNTIEVLILPVLLRYNNFYELRDVEYINEVCNKLGKILKNNIANTSKDKFNREVWICTCGKKVKSEEERCSMCGRNRNGLFYNQETMITKTINFLNEIVNIIESQSKQNQKEIK